MDARVAAVAAGGGHDFSKECRDAVRLIAGMGIEGDAHAGARVQHRSRVARDPTQSNRRQVHLIAAELFDALHAQGFLVRPGQLGENITTRGIDLLGLPTGTRLHLGETALVEVTGLRNPCPQIDAFLPGLLAVLRTQDADGRVVRKAGIMAVVAEGGEVCPGDPVRVTLPRRPHRPLEPV